MRNVENKINVLIVLEVVEAIAISMLVLLLILFLGLVIHKMILERRAKKFSVLEKRYADQLEKVKTGEVTVIVEPPQNYLERKVFAGALKKFRTKKRLIDPLLLQLMADMNFFEAIKKDSSAGNIGRKIVCVELLGSLGVIGFRNYFIESLKTPKDKRIYSSSIRSLARLTENKNDLFLLADLLSEGPSISGSFNESIFLEAFEALLDKRAPQALLEMVKELYEYVDVNSFMRMDIISACGRSGLIAFAPLLENIYENSSDKSGARIASIRALGNLNIRSQCIILALGDSNWSVRAVAAKYAYIFGSKVVSDLVRLLVDQSFYVRENAAIGLTKIGGAGIDALRGALTSADKFQREIAHYALSVKAVHD